MNSLLELRERMKEFYADYDVYIRPVLRFAIAIISFMAITNTIGYMSILNNLFVVVILAVICAILPLNGVVLIGCTLIVANGFGLSPIVGAFALALYLLMVLLYFRFVPKEALAIILTPAAFVLHVPVVVPLTLGLLRGPLSSITVICGILSWKFIEGLPKTIEPLINSKDANLLDTIQAVPKVLVSADTILSLITCVVVVLIVSAIRKLVSTRSWEIAIVVGSVIYLGLTIAGGMILGADVNYVYEVVGTVSSILVCLVLEFFCYSADYRGSEYLQFEDERNYYYVKVTPKKRPQYDTDLEEEMDEEDNIASGDDALFIQRREPSEVEKKFEGINLQSKLEESLKTLNTNQTGRENTPESSRDDVYNPNAAHTGFVPRSEIEDMPTMNLGGVSESLKGSLRADDAFNPEAGETKRL
jgi:hypothetical protein